jgi:hypothetical protein
MKNVLSALAVLASLVAGCGGEPAKRSDTATVQLTAAAGGASRLIGPSSTCGHGAPPDIVLACGIRAAHPRVKPLPVRPGATITLRFEAKVGRLLVQE